MVGEGRLMGCHQPHEVALRGTESKGKGGAKEQKQSGRACAAQPTVNEGLSAAWCCWAGWQVGAMSPTRATNAPLAAHV